MELRSTTSTLICRMQYLRLTPEFRAKYPRRTGILLVTLASGSAYAYLVPSWTAGLVASASVRHTSLGRLYNRIIKGRPSVKLLDTLDTLEKETPA